MSGKGKRGPRGLGAPSEALMWAKKASAVNLRVGEIAGKLSGLYSELQALYFREWELLQSIEREELEITKLLALDSD